MTASTTIKDICTWARFQQVRTRVNLVCNNIQSICWKNLVIVEPSMIKRQPFEDILSYWCEHTVRSSAATRFQQPIAFRIVEEFQESDPFGSSFVELADYFFNCQIEARDGLTASQ